MFELLKVLKLFMLGTFLLGNSPMEAAIEGELEKEGNAAAAAPGEAGKEPAAKEGAEKEDTAAADDPEFDLADLGKHKKSDIKKWKEGHLLQEDYTKKTQTLSEEREKLKELNDVWAGIANHPTLKKIVVDIIQGSFGEKGYNEDYIKELVNKLEAKKEEVEEKTEDIEAALAELDPESPQYKILKQALISNKALEKQLKELSGKFEEKERSAVVSEQTKQFEGQVQQAQKVLSGELDKMSDAALPDGFKFETDEEKKLWRMAVITHLQRNPKEYISEADFLATIKEIGKAWYTQLQKVGEAKIAAYIKSKGLPQKKEGEKEKTPAASAGQKTGSLQDRIEAALVEEGKKETQT